MNLALKTLRSIVLSSTALFLATSLATVATLAFTTGAAHAGTSLPDPFQPPRGFRVMSGASAPGADTLPKLQMVLIGAARKIAIIDGKAVELGQPVGTLRLTRLTPGGAELSDGQKVALKLTLPSAASAAAQASADRSDAAVRAAVLAASSAPATAVLPMATLAPVTPPTPAEKP